jgi:hypothetical protein
MIRALTGRSGGQQLGGDDVHGHRADVIALLAHQIQAATGTLIFQREIAAKDAPLAAARAAPRQASDQ